ncbi:MAG: class I SAM-dependent methyltransferase [Gammaproteobacteria bacterium]
MNSNFFSPRLTELTERLTSVDSVRQRVTECATGHVLDLCVRNRRDLFHYPPTITSLTLLAPSRAFSALSRQRARHSAFPVDLREGECTHIPLRDHRFDCVVSTFALCRIARLDLVLAEVKRVLKPTGRLLFAEYGLSREPSIANWQHRFGWIIGTVHGVSSPMRIIDDALTAGGLVVRSSTCSYLPRVPRSLGCFYEGVADNAE